MTPRRRAALADCTAQQFTCVLFDLDDTLFDSTGTLQAPALAKALGVPQPEWCSWWISEAWVTQDREGQKDDAPMPRSTPPKPTRL